MRNIKRIAAATALATGLGLAGMGAASVAEAFPGPIGPAPDYHWCPGQYWDPGWGNNWDGGRCHDDGYYDGEPRDQGHWHGYGDWHQDGPGGWNNGWDRDHGPGWDGDHGRGWQH
ncbi:MAG: hypothetical protein JO259_12345 [Mycobacterium sp.]|nr:hypothetical protein [Mycobacterium sp.]